MNFTTKTMTEQLVQNMYQKTTDATYTKNGKAGNNKNAEAAKNDEAAVYEGSVKQPACNGKSRILSPVRRWTAARTD